MGYADPDFYPSMLLSTLLGGGMSSRLFQEIRERRGLVYSIYSFTAPAMDGGLFAIYAGTGEEEAKELVPVTLEELRRVQVDANEDELRRARAQVKAGLLMSLESTGSRCEQLARQLQVFGRIVPVAETVAKIEAVTLAGVRRAAGRIFRGRPTLAAMGPAAQVPRPRRHRRPAGSMSGAQLDLLTALLDRARAAGADTAEAAVSGSTSVSVSRRLGATEHLERSERRGLELTVYRRPSQRHRLHHRTCRRRVCGFGRTRGGDGEGRAGGPLWRAGRRGAPGRRGPLELADRYGAVRSHAHRPRRHGRGCRARRARRHQFRRRGSRVRPLANSCSRPAPGLPAAMPGPAIPSAPPRLPGKARACSGTTTITPPSSWPTWRTRPPSAAAPGSRRWHG